MPKTIILLGTFDTSAVGFFGAPSIECLPTETAINTQTESLRT